MSNLRSARLVETCSRFRLALGCRHITISVAKTVSSFSSPGTVSFTDNLEMPRPCASQCYFLLYTCALLLAVSGALTAQQLDRTNHQATSSIPHAHNQATRSDAPVRPMKFSGWGHPTGNAADYRLRFSRPRARVARPEQLASAVKSATSHLSSQASALALPGFQFRNSLPAGYLPTGVVTGDFNGDGKLDFVVANGGDNNLWLYLGKGDGTFNLPTIIPITKGLTPVWLSTADLRGIGKLDLLVAEADSSTVGVFFGNGDGTFVEKAFSLPGAPGALLAGDFNRDGIQDIAVAINDTNSTANLVVLPGVGGGGFGKSIVTHLSNNYAAENFWLSSGDVNKDGYPDLLVTSAFADISVEIFLNQGDATFSAGQVVAQSGLAQVTSTALFDGDEDGQLDAIATDAFGSLYFFHGNGDGTFSTNPSTAQFGDVPYGLAVADVNGDGHLDILASGVFVSDAAPYGSVAGNLLCVLFGDGTGNFGPAKVYRGDSGGFALALGDFNGDGKFDAVTANQDTDSAVVFLNDGQGGFGDPQGLGIGYQGYGPVNAPLTSAIPVDIDGNGTTDLVLMEFNQLPSNFYQITSLLNDGTGHFSYPIRSDGVDQNYLAVGDFVLADFRNTGKPDFLAIASSYASTPYVTFAPNMGGGQFGPEVTTTPSGAFGVIAVGDFNKDGKLDFAATGYGASSNPNNESGLQVFLGNGDGTFRTGASQTFQTYLGPPDAAYVGDFNRDGKEDLLLFFQAAPGGASVYELLGNGNGTFQAEKPMLSAFDLMTVADVNRDGWPDIIATAPGVTFSGLPYQVQIYLGQSNGTFTLANTYTPFPDQILNLQAAYATKAAEHFAPQIADFNGDGNLDIAAFQSATAYPERDLFVEFLLGNGDGTFTPTYNLFDFKKPEATMFPADVNGDGLADLVELDGYRASFNVLTNIVGPQFQFALVADPVTGATGEGLLTIPLPSSGGTTIQLSASDPAISVPATVTIPAGQTGQTFSFTIGSAFNANHVFAITAQLGSESAVAYGTQEVAGAAGFTTTLNGLYFNTSLNLAAGQSSSALGLGAFSLGGYTSTLSLQCLGLPATVQCQFSPLTIPVRPGSESLSDIEIIVAPGTALGAYPVIVRATDGILTYDTPFTLNVGDFSMAFTPTTQRLFPTQTLNYELTLTSIYNYIQPVNLACGGLPVSISCGGYPFADPAPGGAMTPITIQTQSTPVGNYTFTETGTSTPLTHTASGTVQVWDYNVSVSPLSATIAPGASTTFPITVQSLNAFNGPLGLYCSVSNSIIGCSFDSSTLNVSANGTATATLTVSAKPGRSASARSFGTWGSEMLLGLLAGFVLLARDNRKKVGSCSLALILLSSLLSCGGGGSSANGSNGGGTPPPNTYSVSVQVTSGTYVKSAGPITITVK